MNLIPRLSTPDQVKPLFGILTEEEKTALNLRQDFRGRLIIDLSRQFHSGSVVLEKIWKMPMGENPTSWEPVSTEESDMHELPKDFVLYLFGAAVQHPWFKARMIEYYGGIPEIEL